MINPFSPPLPVSLFLRWLLASITVISNPLFNTYVVVPLLKNLLKLIFYPTLTPSGINPTSLDCISLNASWKKSSKSLILILSPTYLWNTQPSNKLSLSTSAYIHIPTHLLTLIPESVISTKGSICHFSPVSPLNRPFKVTMICDCSLLSLVSYQIFSIPFKDVWKTSSPAILRRALSPQLPSNMISPFSEFLPPFFTRCPIPPTDPLPSR